MMSSLRQRVRDPSIVVSPTGITGRVTARRTGAVLLVIVVAELLALAVNRSLVRVAGASMEPALTDGDVVLTVPATRRARLPGRVVVVEDPTEPGHLVVKRIHAVDESGIDVRGDLPERSTDSRTWGRLPHGAVRRLVVARWPDLRTSLHHHRSHHRAASPHDEPTQPSRAGRVATSSSSGSSSATSPSERRA